MDGMDIQSHFPYNFKNSVSILFTGYGGYNDRGGYGGKLVPSLDFINILISNTHLLAILFISPLIERWRIRYV